jgi:prenylcysteine alpha-carboxyl methylesterase
MFSLRLLFLALRLVLFGILLLPGFLKVAHYYATSKRRLTARYGPNPRNRLDIYVPRSGKKVPVLVFVSGGAWIIGHNSWGAFIGKTLQEENVLVVSPDYRNYPQATITTMISDVQQAIEWVFQNCQRYGGDASNIHLCGQSAGAHLSIMSLMKRAQSLHHNARKDRVTWDPRSIRSFIGISGVFDLHIQQHVFSQKGLPESVIRKLFEGDITAHSPSHLIRESHSIVHYIPRIHLLHGTKDGSAPITGAQSFQSACDALGLSYSSKFYAEQTHTDPIIEGPMRGCNELSLDVLKILCGIDQVPDELHQRFLHGKPLVPLFLVRAAMFINPFA